jgi:COP9 signalosome complex subunit 7
MFNNLTLVASLKPFLALSKSATSPRAAADLIERATSAQSTFIFTELLQSPQIQALSSDSDFLPHLNLLRIFSYGTYETYLSGTGLPPLNDAQTLKLRQLSLLSLASDRSNLTYERLQQSLRLSSAQQLESLVTTAIYAGLIHAKLDPARQKVQVTSVAPLRDLSPGAVPQMISVLRAWSDRCSELLVGLDKHVADAQKTATARTKEEKAAADKLKKVMADLKEADKKVDMAGPTREMLARRGLNKRSMVEAGKAPSEEAMDMDAPFGTADDIKKRVSKRKM